MSVFRCLDCPIIGEAGSGFPVQGGMVCADCANRRERAERDAAASPPQVWIRFAENGNIRKWHTDPFEGAELYVRVPPED